MNVMICKHCGLDKLTAYTAPCASNCTHEFVEVPPLRADDPFVPMTMYNQTYKPDTTAEDAIRSVLKELLPVSALSPETLANTPSRFTRAILEMTEGYQDDPKEILSKTFEEESDEIVVLKDVAFTSLCEHHILSFTGSVSLGYLPSAGIGKVVGLSKLARLVDCFSRRLQMQERMTRQIAQALMDHLGARGAAVIVKGQHSCMSCRGIKKSGATMITSCMLGVFREDIPARQEFLTLCQ